MSTAGDTCAPLFDLAATVASTPLTAAVTSDVCRPRGRVLQTCPCVYHPIGCRENTRSGCLHTLHVRNGTIVDVALADVGSPVVVPEATRKPVKRAKRGDGTWRFNMCVTIECRHGNFDIWASPHATDARSWLPEHIRLLPPDDPAFAPLYGRRNDVEALNNTFKRSLLVDRATSVGWQRQLVDMYSYAILQTAQPEAPRTRRCGHFGSPD